MWLRSSSRVLGTVRPGWSTGFAAVGTKRLFSAVINLSDNEAVQKFIRQKPKSVLYFTAVRRVHELVVVQVEEDNRRPQSDLSNDRAICRPFT